MYKIKLFVSYNIATNQTTTTTTQQQKQASVCSWLGVCLKYRFWYSIYSVVVKYWLWLGKIDNPNCESQANFTHSKQTNISQVLPLFFFFNNEFYMWQLLKTLLNETKSGTTHLWFYCLYLGSMQESSQPCHKEVIMRSKQGRKEASRSVIRYNL